ncbi:DUF3800 domain-containing protein [Clostridium perfringens]|nr:DUF3800 domain-containing protein [Clostridium perfringens]MDM1014602.1 DUF3800 domain-containing protein [Clostridium perfringens]
MGYYIFFDESGKIDRQRNKYSYYGALGIKKSEHKFMNETFLKEEIGRELHFRKFSLHNLDSYLNVMNKLLEISVFNIYLVNNEKALCVADKLSIDKSKLRELLYIKIPERLMYGILRHFDDFYNTKIIIDKCDEYDKYNIESKLEYQLNAQSVYRDKKYIINEVKQMDSKDDICLQGIDILIGIISFIIDKKYCSYREDLNEKDFNYIMNIANDDEKKIIGQSYKNKNNEYKLSIRGDGEKLKILRDIYDKYKFYTQLSIQKSEFIYRLLNSEKKLNSISKIGIFMWNQEEEIFIQNINDYISKFILFKSQFDDYNKMKIVKKYKESELKNNEEYEELLGFGRNSSIIVQRYLEELDVNF